MNKKSGTGFVLGAALGAVIGAIGGVLYAPKKGDETRKELKEKLDEYSEKANAAAKELQDKSKNIAEDVKEFGANLKKTADEKIQSVTGGENSESKEAPSAKTAASSKKKYFKGV
jgi:gas vesicle protein